MQSYIHIEKTLMKNKRDIKTMYWTENKKFSPIL